MATTRADQNTQLQKKQELFSDFLTNMDAHPVTRGLAKTTNENAVRQSLKSLILTNLGERPFQPNIGSDVRRSLFEPNDAVTAQDIVQAIKSCVKYCEPRANLLDVRAFPSGEEGFVISIVFSVINNTEPLALEFILKRVR